MVLHVPALLHPHKVLHRVQILPGARTSQELLHGHGVPQVHSRVRVIRHGHFVGALRLIPGAAHLHGATTGSAVGARQHWRTTLSGATSCEQVVEQ